MKAEDYIKNKVLKFYSNQIQALIAKKKSKQNIEINDFKSNKTKEIVLHDNKYDFNVFK